MHISFATSLFHKALHDIDQNDLEKFFEAERDESLTLEFKSYADSKSLDKSERISGVFKTVVAFLNSSGGLLVWGAPESTPSTTNLKSKICTGPLSPVLEYFDRDVLVSKLVDSIDPRPHNIDVNPIRINGGYVYLIEVQESSNKPHQVKGKGTLFSAFLIARVPNTSALGTSSI
ncbi:AlbA family DNA-binding domain-containing protein [Larkinella rosea]|uniref:ATP-binding protein n=1 Tax=Larkinella rosea TaxID=2025312 RepID=A0A3P1BIL5_9BACT|nr:ATP-binding protein [Larkinella rosea]RRB00673.1 ATP-binding protein [Larkinella rosea]